MSGLLDRLTHLHGALVYAIVGALVFAEDALLVGLVLPGETAAILGGVTASLGRTDLVTMAGVVVAAAVLGDATGYQIGYHFGPRLLDIGPLARRRERVQAAERTLTEHGAPAVFFGRFVAFLRTLIPFLAGTARMRYRTFLFFNATSGLLWGVGNVLLGYAVGASYRAIEGTYGTAAAALAAVVVIALVIVWQVRRRRRR
jgi:membrane-associated protein